MEDRGTILRKGTRKILETINDCAVRFYEQNDVVIERYELIDKLRLSIEILKSGDFSKKSLIDELTRLSAPATWEDFMFLKMYNNAQLIWENAVNRLQNDLKNEDDEYTQLCLRDDINRYNDKLKNINDIILLATDFKALILGVIPDLEAVFAKLLQEHEKLQAKHENEALERKKRIAENISIMKKKTIDSGGKKYIFCNEVLQSFSKFDGLLWDKLDIDWFRLEQPKKIVLLKTCTQPMFVYFFDKYLDKKLCTSPTSWLPLIFTNAFSYSNQNKANTIQTTAIYNAKKKNISLNKKFKAVDEFRIKFDKLYSMT